MTPDFTHHGSRVALARLTGGLYLAYIAASILADRLGHIGLGSVQQVYEATLKVGLSFRAGLLVALVSALLFALVAWGLYVLLRPVNRELALLFLLLNAVGVAVQCASMLPLISAMLQDDPASRMRAFSSAQLAGLGSLAAGTYKTGFVTTQLFFGAWLFPLGYLVYRSRFLPRLLGVLLLLDGVAVMIWLLQALLLPAHPVVSRPGLVVSFVAEFGLGLWLIVKAVRPAGGLPAQQGQDGDGAQRPSRAVPAGRTTGAPT
jgi:hypothetical protein